MAEAPTLHQQRDLLAKVFKLHNLIENSAKEQGIFFNTLSSEVHRASISTGVLGLDLLLGGGHQPGRFSYFFGPTGSCKSTLVFQTIREAIKRGIKVVFLDYEASTDPVYLENLGIDVLQVGGARSKTGWDREPELYYTTPDTAEHGFRSIHSMLKSLGDKIMMEDPKHGMRYFVVTPGHQYTRDWKSVTKGLEDKKIFEVEDATPQMLFVVDSLRMLAGAKDEDNSKETIAMLARALNECFTLVKPYLGRKLCNLVGTNHLNINPMARFGCLHAETPVPFVDGRSLTMREIVENQITGKVWSYDEESKKIVPAEIINWYFNGKVDTPEDFVTITGEAVDTKNGVYSFTCTKDHQVLTAEGWKKAVECSTQDTLITKYESVINGTLKSFLLGAFVGDSTLSSSHGERHALRLQDNTNLEYVKWKIDKLDVLNFRKVPSKLPSYSSESRHEFSRWKKRIGNRDPLTVLNEMDDLSLAVWYMDDGCLSVDKDYGYIRSSISVKRLARDTERLLAIKELLGAKGLEVTVGGGEGTLRFTRKSTRELGSRIAKYVPECMQYKLPEEFRGQYLEFDLDHCPTIEVEYVPISSVQCGSRRKFRQRGKYDIQVEKHHNYLVGNKENGVVVHNSPETEPGGKAVEFFPDNKTKLMVNRAMSKIITEPHASGVGEDRYLPGTATVIKNKGGPVFRKMDYRVWIDEQGEPGRGFCPVFDIYQFLLATGQVNQNEKTGNLTVLPSGFEDIRDVKYSEFKKAVLSDTGEKLRKFCFDQIKDGIAQEKYYENVKSLKTDANQKKKAKKFAGLEASTGMGDDDDKDDDFAEDSPMGESIAI